MNDENVMDEFRSQESDHNDIEGEIKIEYTDDIADT